MKNKLPYYSNNPWQDFLRKCMRVREFTGYRSDDARRKAAIEAFNKGSNETDNQTTNKSNKPKG